MSRTSWLFLGILFAGCSGIDVSHDYDRSADFSKLKTWSWAPGAAQTTSEISRVSSLTTERIRSAVEGELGLKGFSKVDQSKADFWVKQYAAVGQRIQVDPGYDYSWYGDDIQVYEEGTIVVDVLSPKDKRLIWRGTARKAVDSDATPEEREATIREAVTDILEDFPPQK